VKQPNRPQPATDRLVLHLEGLALNQLYPSLFDGGRERFAFRLKCHFSSSNPTLKPVHVKDIVGSSFDAHLEI
jgi:hypothetical protein